MPKIDFSRAVTAEMRAAEMARHRAAEIKADCAARIVAVMDARTLLNLQGAAITDALSRSQMRTFREARQWVADMQSACRTAIATGQAPDWPEIPVGLAALAEEF